MDGIFGLGFTEYPNLGAPMSTVKHFMDKEQFTVWMNRRGYIRQGNNTDRCGPLPRMIFRIAGRRFTVPSVQYVLDLNLRNGQCVMALFAVDSAAFGAQFILGQPFIRTFCQTYDIANKRIGISVARPQQTCTVDNYSRLTMY
ncbi:hypothetical protein ANCDUO_09214 [Ancylostoma duodenale]|uniref:Peptidase A1 domain-containing protein n=1 Tax=Ancylostoma duodenale TaxID=51022 RepID=A0A0C2GH65_9BILA|nr:hypothetical protein ANCDUO_09214 [Ancylostoma duodenale]